MSEKKKPKLGDKLISGAVAGVAGTLLIYPLDSIKTAIQSNSKLPSSFRHFYFGLSANLVGIMLLLLI